MHEDIKAKAKAAGNMSVLTAMFDGSRLYNSHTCLTGYREPMVSKELNFSQLVISIGSRRNWRPL